jgi:CBS domain containing-hemolysin-like protein|tara:strand:+ start:2285 stop:2473 length:189 start_codon:yes stop_codon:yes gene_type:complete
MSKNIQLTAIQQDYNQHLNKQLELRDSAVKRIIKIREEITILDNEEAKLEEIINTLDETKIS